MNRLLLLCALSVCATSCTFISTPQTESLYLVDFQRYTDEGFFITPALSINEVYNPISMIEYRVVAGLDKGELRIKDSSDEMIEKFVFSAKKMGANAILGFAFNLQRASGGDITGCTLSGYAVNIVNRQPAQPTSAIE